MFQSLKIRYKFIAIYKDIHVHHVIFQTFSYQEYIQYRFIVSDNTIIHIASKTLLNIVGKQSI